MSEYTRRFWTECHRYHDLARDFTESIEVKHPKVVSCRCGWVSNCTWCATSVTYYKNTGASV